MSQVKQVSLLPAGCQQWNICVCAASGDRFAYCATLAIYIYQLDVKYNEFKLHSIMSKHKKTITAICWNPTDGDLLASTSCDREIIIWNIPQQSIISRLEKLTQIPIALGWSIHDNVVTFVASCGSLTFWDYSISGATLISHKQTQNFASDVCHFRLHHTQIGKFVFGHMDGSISLFCKGKKPQKHVLRPSDLVETADAKDPVLGLEWDPLSSEYLLIARTYTGVMLIDADAVSVIQRYRLPSAAAQVRTVAWVHSAPGMFITGDDQSGVLRIWAVPNPTPLVNLKIKKTGLGFFALHVFSTAPGKRSQQDASAHSMDDSLRPPAYAVCTFQDGGVGLYDLTKRRWYFLREQGHVETIFDCKFKPQSSELLATASFDGTIKVWDVNTLTAVNSSPGNEGIIYCISWAPADLDCVAASTAKHGVFIWDLQKNQIIQRYTEHGSNPVYSVAWNQKDSRRIASCSGDGFCIVRQVDREILAKFKHPGPVFGCDWNPTNKDMLATGCEDGRVRVFYMPTGKQQAREPLKTFSGHTAKVFNVRWSPLRDGWLCSGSDDGTIRIWDYAKDDSCIKVLEGHTAPVRALLWNSEIPYLLISGSWDYTMRIWDVRDGTCLDTVLDHGGDVYGLTSHPDRPFVFASSSRDSTVRVWSLSPLLQPLQLNVIAGKHWDDFIASPADPERWVSLGTPPLLCGKASKDLKLSLERTSDVKAKILQTFSKFFSSPNGSSNLWELVSVIRGMDGSALSLDYHKGVMNTKHLLKFKASKAQELEILTNSGGITSKSREKRLREASEIYLRVGNLQRYCDAMAELGEWDKALAVAPGVSMRYWKELCEKRVSQLKREESELIVPYAVAVGDVKSLVQHFTGRGQMEDAMVVATAGHEGNITEPQVYSPHLNGAQSYEQHSDHGDTSSSLLSTTSTQLADGYLQNGCAVMAACCHLAVNDHQGAMTKLLRGNELELAVSVGTVLGTTPQLLHIATELLARRCERLGKWELGVDLLQSMPDKLPVARLCARCAASMDEKNHLYQQAGFPSMDDCLSKAEQHSSDVVRRVMYYILSTKPEHALHIGLQFVKDKMNGHKWTVQDIWDVVQLMASIQTEKLQKPKCAQLKGELLIISTYVGVHVALRRQYHSIVRPLFKQTLKLMKQETQCSLPLSESLVSSELDAFIAHHRQQHMNAEQERIMEALLSRAGDEPCPYEPGEDIISSSNLPCHSDVHESYFTANTIQGPAFFLEDGWSAIAINEALMWAKVTPFSPLGTGVRINPF